MAILEKIIITILALFPLGELIRINVVNGVTIHPVDFFIALLGLVWIILQLKNKKNILKLQHVKPIVIFITFCIISLTANIYWLNPQELAISSLYLIRWIMYVLVYFVVKDMSQQFKNKVVRPFLLIDGLIILIAGLFQLYFYPSLISMAQYQWDLHIYRLFSVFLDPNYTGIFLVLYLIFILPFLLNNIKNKNKLLIFRFGLLSIANIIAIFLTYSRSAILSQIASVTVFLVLIKKTKLIIFLFVIILIFVVLSSPNFYIENTNLFRLRSSIERIESARIALRIIETNPVFGVGFNAYRYAQIKYNFRESSEEFSSHADSGTDNSFLFVTATTGVVGLTSYLYIWYNFLRKHYQKRKANTNSKVILACFAGLCVGSLFINALFYAPIMLWMWFLLAIND